MTLGEGEVDGELEYEDGCAVGRDTHDDPLFVWLIGLFRLGPEALYWRILLPLLGVSEMEVGPVRLLTIVMVSNGILNCPG